MKQIIILTTYLLIININVFAQGTQNEISWPTLADSDWPMIKHDPQFTGRSPYKGPQTPTVVWQKDIPDGIYCGPVIGEDDNLYFGSYYQLLDSSDNFYSYTSDGEIRWKYKLGNNRPPQSGIVIDSSNTIYFGALDQYFYALNPDGTLKWRYKTGYITELIIPNIDTVGNLYVTNNPEGDLLSIASDGTLNWKINFDSGFLLKSPAMSPDGEALYIAGKDSDLYAIDLDGNLIWKFKCGLFRHPPVVDNDGNIYFIPEESPQKLYSLKPDGEVRWTVTISSGSIYIYSTPTIDSQGNIYLAQYNRLFSYKYDGSFRWRYVFDDSTLATTEEIWQPLICDSEGTIYLGSTYGMYYYAISSEGELKWKLPLDGNQVDNTGAITKDGTLFLGLHVSSMWNQNEKNLIAIKDTSQSNITDHTLCTRFKLSQNYPNPFNPITTIKYDIPNKTDVNLSVYDITGRLVDNLVNRTQSAGSYSVQWNASNVSSGVYIYRIDAGEFISVKKCLVVK